jgi:hypothetical protein
MQKPLGLNIPQPLLATADGGDRMSGEHDTENPHRVFISGQKRGVFGLIKRELQRRSAIGFFLSVISHFNCSKWVKS